MMPSLNSSVPQLAMAAAGAGMKDLEWDDAN